MQKRVKPLRNHTCYADWYLQINRFSNTTHCHIAISFVLYFICVIHTLHHYRYLQIHNLQNDKTATKKTIDAFLSDGTNIL